MQRSRTPLIVLYSGFALFIGSPVRAEAPPVSEGGVLVWYLPPRFLRRLA